MKSFFFESIGFHIAILVGNIPILNARLMQHSIPIDSAKGAFEWQHGVPTIADKCTV